LMLTGTLMGMQHPENNELLSLNLLQIFILFISTGS